MDIDIYSPPHKYDLIYADPPWQYHAMTKPNGRHHCGAASWKYDTMPIAEIKELPIAENIASKDAVLFLWVTPPCLEEGLEVMKSWGFKYTTIGFTWVKQNRKSDDIKLGLGYYTRANAELCLLGTRGKHLPRISHSVQQVIISHIEEHSKKPDEARNRIVELFGDRPRIELFSRKHVDGWDCWGNETDKFDEEEQVSFNDLLNKSNNSPAKLKIDTQRKYKMKNILGIEIENIQKDEERD